MPVDTSNAKILIVDDEHLNIDMLRLLLKKNGYQNVISTSDPSQVAALYQQHYPDLVLLDLHMPVLDGFSVLQALKAVERRSYLPVMVLTSETDDASRLRVLELGAKDFLNKPFNNLEVLTRIRNMLEVKLMHTELRNQNVILDQKVRERTSQLQGAQLEIVQRLGLAAEYRDNETGAHILRMSHYSRCLARAYGMSEADSELMLHASPMHDIGKIGIPDNILLKPGKLTEDEFAIMKTHAAIGAEVLSNGKSELMTIAQTIALTHHEKWNGAGYPNGLGGEDIPLWGRIVAVCDVFDALTSARPYKPAWSVDDALKELRQQQGKHFEPGLIDLFHDILPEILEIKASYHD